MIYYLDSLFHYLQNLKKKIILKILENFYPRKLAVFFLFF